MNFNTEDTPVRLWYFTSTGEAKSQQWMADQVHELSQGLLGRVKMEEEYTQLVAAHPGDTVALLAHLPAPQHIQVWLHGHVSLNPTGVRYEYKVKYGVGSRDADKPLSLQMFEVDPKIQRNGVAAHIFALQAQAAFGQGFRAISAFGDRDREKGRNGHYTWPRLGFDAALTPEDEKKLPQFLQGASRLNEIFSTEEGRLWWQDNGWPMFMDFGTSPQSGSMRTLKSYMAARSYEWPSVAIEAPLYRHVTTLRPSRGEKP